MLGSSEVELLAYLLNEKEEKMEKLIRILTSNPSAIQESISRINHYSGKTIIINDGNEITLLEKNIAAVYELMRPHKDSIYNYFSVDFRRSLMLLKMLIKNEYTSLLDLANLVYISKNTALNDIKQIKKQLVSAPIELTYTRKEGYQVMGDELSLRRLLNREVAKVLETPIGNFLLSELNLIDKNESAFLKQRLEKVEKRLEIIFSDEIFDILPYTSLAVVERIKNFSISCEFSEEINKLRDTKEYITIASVFWNYTFLEENDLLYLVLLVLSSNVVESEITIDSSIQEFKQLESVVDEFISSIESKLAINFFNKRKIKNSLVRHLNPALYRSMLGLSVLNPLADQFISEYEALYNVVEREMHRFEVFTKHPFSKDETAFIAMIVLSSIIEEHEWLTPKTFTAVVVCKSGTSVSKLLTEHLKDLFPNIKFERVLSLRQYNMEKVQEDFVFSTLPLNNKRNTFVVSSLMTQEEKEQLKQNVYQYIERDSAKKSKYIISYLSEFLEENKKEEAFSRLYSFFSKDETEELEEKKSTSFLESTSQITIYEEPFLWEDVVDITFSELLQRESVTMDYVRRCGEIFDESYESLLIGPEVLMPHASSEDGVLKPDVQINVFRKPLTAPNGQTYYLMVSLAPGEKNEHVDWLIQLNKQLLQPNTKRLIEETNDKQNLLQLFNNM
ncbi:BglG family transcription antiterminator [Atopococcus tabaci]|uniref:BglG family transcription antiterminator n=1 Tax=Atopococcus tabaci TaxID=269774 RepID=UPI000420642F|nr:BglG family transcription antiterminator [Atopococcus tabaci]